jgi:hypothetical protein
MVTYGWELEASILSPVNVITKIGKTWLSANPPSWKLAFVLVAQLIFIGIYDL